MYFRTELNPGPLSRKINHSMAGISLGSCFAGNIARKLGNAKFQVADNPFGVLFNPFSIAGALEDLHEGRSYSESELVCNGDMWCHFSFHGSFNRPDKGEALAGINRACAEGAGHLKKADYVILTFGTAWVFEPAERAGEVVANCHKFPAARFTRRRLAVDEIVARYDRLMAGPLRDKHVIITVSPVRHLKDGFSGNSASKAVLILAAERLTGKYSNADYFPAYELLNDDLRDYRFYAEDMIHPTETAVDYVWEKFRESAFDSRTADAAAEAEKITAAAAHRPLNPASAAYSAFCRQMLSRIDDLKSRFPEIDFGGERGHFSAGL